MHQGYSLAVALTCAACTPVAFPAALRFEGGISILPVVCLRTLGSIRRSIERESRASERRYMWKRAQMEARRPVRRRGLAGEAEGRVRHWAGEPTGAGGGCDGRARLRASHRGGGAASASAQAERPAPLLLGCGSSCSVNDHRTQTVERSPGGSKPGRLGLKPAVVPPLSFCPSTP